MLLTHTQILWLHASPAFLALILGSLILASKKGTTTHKFRGYTWLGLMLIAAVSAIFIEEINPGSFSYIHLFVPWTIFWVFWGTYYIKKYQATGDKKWLESHKYSMTWLFYGSGVLAGLLALAPGRIIHGLLFG